MLSSGAIGVGNDHPDRTRLQPAPGSGAYKLTTQRPMGSRRARMAEVGRIRPASPGRRCLVPRGGSGEGGRNEEEFSCPPPRTGVRAGSARDHNVVPQRSSLVPEALGDAEDGSTIAGGRKRSATAPD